MGTIRTLLAVSVLITHSERILGVQLLSGDMAVTCFYVLSGFLITLILNERYADLKAFFVNRALRIYVPYFSALALGVIVYSVTSSSAHDPSALYGRVVHSDGLAFLIWSTISNLTLIGTDLTRYIALQDDFSIAFPNFLQLDAGGGGHGLLFVPQAWTLALELQFYLLAPFLVRSRLLVLAALTSGFLVTRLVLFQRIRERGIPIDDAAIFPMQLGYFLLGALGYHGYRGIRAWRAPERVKVLLAAVMSLLALSMVVKGLDVMRDRERADYDVFYVIFAATVPFQFYLTRNWRMDSRIGDFSYPIYVFHFALAGLITSWDLGARHGEAVLVMTLAVSGAYLALVDAPVQRLRRRIRMRSQSTPETGGPATPQRARRPRPLTAGARLWPVPAGAVMIVTPLSLLAAIAFRGAGVPEAPQAPPGQANAISVLAPSPGDMEEDDTVTIRVKVNGKLASESQFRTDRSEGVVHLHFQLDGGRFDRPPYSDSDFLALEESAGQYSPSIDGRITYRGLPPGEHVLRVELVHNDHDPGSGLAGEEIRFTTR